MSTAGVQGGIAGAAGGAVAGAQMGTIFGLPGMVVGGVIGGIGGLISGNSAAAQHDNAAAWAEYNRQMQRGTDMYNIQSSLMIAGLNASLARAAGAAQSASILAAAKYNANIIGLTTDYNTQLLEEEMTRVWNDLDLDIRQIEMFRSRERGTMLADQAGSGTVMGEGSNAILVIDQMTMEALDVTIAEFGADRSAANISNQIAQGQWQGEVAIQQTMWEGEMAAYNATYNANLQATGAYASAVIQADANMYSSKQAFMAGGNNITQAEYQFDQTQTQNMIKGLFTAAATGAAASYAAKIPKLPAPGGAGSTLATNNYSTGFGQQVYLGQSGPQTGTNLLTRGL